MTDHAHIPSTHRCVSALVPARDEAACIVGVVRALFEQRRADGTPLIDEVVVADNGSRDATADLARAAGAHVVDVPIAGYGRARMDAARARLVELVEAGADLAVGVRAAPEPGAMSMPQRFGNALACELLRRLWRLDLADLGPHRALARDAFFALELEDRSFGWMVEMSVRAHKLGLVCAATPVCWRARAGGISKIGGNIIGVVKAGVGILGMIARLAWRERRRPTRVFHRRAVRAAHPIPQPEGEHS